MKVGHNPEEASIVAYHLNELELARRPEDSRHLLPDIPSDCASILDVGCGAGQTLIALGEKTAGRSTYGVDVDCAPLAVGRRMAPGIHFIAGVGERLPFREACMDMIVCRVSLPYMHIPRALREFHRILRPGGYLWLTLHPPAVVWKWLGRALLGGQIKGVIFNAYVLFNGTLFSCTGHQVRFFNGRCESFQTPRSIRGALAAAGFRSVQTHMGQHFLVTAFRGEASPSAESPTQILEGL